MTFLKTFATAAVRAARANARAKLATWAP